ncbi:Crp/Fnr family transcriptional regulator [Paenibacillus mendelii]|uniref:Crp/Fnr family transcriptional regulator n=1 Tax=Paenibacillus mendelii TaxID=206163 RepID=A0ABV6JHJ9_9BACL|nr:cyclic nucleotide-binding domain-containing protein [Paenibacillus mendelii]MCQ6557174.1 cyclic nucleotide-binding domain-containing protein [Paenibacillus mendelii]
MKEIHDRERLNHYLHMYQIVSIFSEQLIPHLSLYSYMPGESICSRGEPSQYLYILVEGKIKIYTTTEEGKTLILSIKKPLEAVGDIEYVHGTDIMNTVEAVSSVHMIVIHHRWLRKYGSDYAPLLQFLLGIITQKFFIKSNSLSFNMMYTVEVRLASYLLSDSLYESDSLHEGLLSTAHLKDAADIIGTSYRHLNRVIKQFCTDGFIERSKGFIHIKNREGLKALAGHNIYE